MSSSFGSAAGRAARRWPVLAAAVAAVGLVVSAAPATGTPTLPGWEEYGFQGEGEARIRDLDARIGRVAPTADQRVLAQRLGATSVSWNAFGTPHVMVNHSGYLSQPREGEAVDVARDFVRENAALFRLSPADVDRLEVLRDSPLYDSPDLGRVYREDQPPQNPDVAHVVLFRQRFEDLPAALDGLLTLGVQSDGRIASVGSSITGDSVLEGARQLSPVEAIRIAAENVALQLGNLTETDVPPARFLAFASTETPDVQRARLIALPTPTEGVRRAWEVILLDSTFDEHGNPTGFTTFIDAESGRVWHRTNMLEHFAQGGAPRTAAPASAALPRTQQTVPLPTWRVFPANPPFVAGLRPEDVESEDTRVLWCWDSNRDPEECAEQQRNTASRLPWDTNPPSLPSFTTDGNNASTAISELSPFTPDTAMSRPVSPTRAYDYPWRNAWFEGSCNPTQFGPTDPVVTGGPNDEAAAVTNLFVMHNRMHDWSYFLGFTEVNSNLQKNNFGNTGPERENDPEVGQAQGGRRTPVFGRDNANQITPPDGISPITNQYLWQPLAGAFYAPCVDGAYDMAVVAHEYGHAITNRMLGGPDGGTGPTQGQTESWSDLQFAAYFTEFAISAGEGVNPYVLGPYVTGDEEAGIRNYAMNNSPLNYSNLDYDGNGLGSPHANGEIWSAVNFDILLSLNRKYDAQFPSTDKALQRACAMGQKPADDCPGNRRWNQIQYDSYLLQPTGVSMVDSRDMMLAADRLRFKGANQNELWDAFAKRGLGESAKTEGPRDVEALAGWDSPLRDDEARITFAAPAGVTDMQVFVGKYEARTTPVADTVADSDIDTSAAFVPGTYEFIAQAPGFGAHRFTETFAAGETRTVTPPLRRNLASVHNGAEATGDGVNLEKLIDDTELTNWASLTSEGTASEGKGEGAQVEGRQVTVDLAGDAPVEVKELQISAVLRGSPGSDAEDLPDPDPGTQSRFSALRSFDILACNAAAGADCTTEEGFTKIFTSAEDAFPSRRPRPRVPDLMLRPFDVTDATATHLRLVVRDNQCTGGPDFQGETNPDADPFFNPDCDTEAGSPDRALLKPPKQLVRAAELQVFGTLAATAAAPTTEAAPPTTAVGRLPATGAVAWTAVLALALLVAAGYGARRLRRGAA